MKSTAELRIKTYYVNSIEDAMLQAKNDLGSEALLLNTRRVFDAGKPSGYEVVLGVSNAAFATLEAPHGICEQRSLEAPPMVSLPPSQEAPHKVSSDCLADELKKLRRQMDEIQELLLRSTENRVLAEAPSPELAEIYSNLLGAHVDPLLCKDIVDRLGTAIASFSLFLSAGNGCLSASQDGASSSKLVLPDAARVKKLLSAVFERSIRISPTIGLIGPSKMKPATILVGPTGGGKTTTAAKLAIAANSAMPVRLLSLDRSRRCGAAHLQSLVSAPGIAVNAVPTLHQLHEMIAESREKHCVLVDTAGNSAGDSHEAEALAAALSVCPELDVHLVVPGHISAADFRRVIEQYSIFHPAKLLITKTDEAETLGAAVSEAKRAELALSFMTNGPSVPQDIRAISSSDLAVMGLQRRGNAGRRAA